MFPAPYEHWRAVVDLVLLEQCGRSLADLPVTDYPLRTWWKHGLTAYTVGVLLASIAPPRATLSRFYTDTRPEEVREQVLSEWRAAHRAQ